MVESILDAIDEIKAMLELMEKNNTNKKPKSTLMEEPGLMLPPPMPLNKIASIFPNFRTLRSSKHGWYAHTGMDIAVPVNTELIAVERSKVSKIVRADHGWGNRIYLKIISGGFRCYRYAYCHCNLIEDLTEGDIVEKGQVIAYTGNSGNSTGPHLHLMFGTNLGWNGYKNKKGECSVIGFLDPYSYFDFEG